MKRYIVMLLLAALLSSCAKFVDIPLPSDALSRDQVFTDDSKANFAVTSIYGFLINTQTFTSNQTTVYGALSSDEVIRFNANVPFDQINKNEITPDNVQTAAIWTTAYKAIFSANAVISGLQQSLTVTEPVKQLLTAECRFIRAFSYFYLVNFYGAVPLIQETDYKENSVKPRAPVSEIYDFMIKELKEIKEQLPAAYNGSEKVRPNKWTAVSLLARIYLYKENWSAAEAECNAVINSGLYTPLESPSLAFLKNSKESIWQLMPSSGVLAETAQMFPSGGIPQNYLRTELLNSFEAGDLRRKSWIDSVTYNTVKYLYPAKYRNASSTIKEYLNVFRIPELFLIRAEAKAMQDRLDEAVPDINIIRQRAGLPPLAAPLTRPEVLVAVEKERKIEFFCEWGHRWFDLIRTNRASDVLGLIKPGWSSSDVIYPVPDREIATNYYLTQNPGY